LFFIPREEEFLLEQYGEDYREYMKKVRWRIIPGIY
jgi:protein-S-isoprenylcysteine O-methyltransferase Ste14